MNIWLQILILLAGYEARTVLVNAWQFRMADDAGVGIVAGEGLQQLVEGMLLLLCAGVFCNTTGIQTSFVDDAKGAVIVMAGMDALDALGQQGDNGPVITDIVVVAALPVHGFATSYQKISAERLIAFIGHAVDDDELD